MVNIKHSVFSLTWDMWENPHTYKPNTEWVFHNDHLYTTDVNVGDGASVICQINTVLSLTKAQCKCAKAMV